MKEFSGRMMGNGMRVDGGRELLRKSSNISEIPLEHNIEGSGIMMMMRSTWKMIEMLDLEGEMEPKGKIMNLAISR